MQTTIGAGADGLPVQFIKQRSTTVAGGCHGTCKRARRRRREGTLGGGDAATAAEGEVSAQTVAEAA